MMRVTKTGVFVLSFVCLVRNCFCFVNVTGYYLELFFFNKVGSTFGMIAHILLLANWEWLQMRLSATSGNHKHVAQTTLYLQIPQHLLEFICLILLFYGTIKVLW